MNDFLNTAIAAAKAGGNVVSENFGHDETRSYKEDNSLFTQTDGDAEKAIIDTILAAHPDHSYFSEEIGASETVSEYQWIIDPVDGTSNFAREIPLVSVSVALTQNGAPVAGAVLAPLTNELFAAAEGEGATLNDRTIKTSDISELSRAFVGFGSRQSGDKQQTARMFNELLPATASYRAFGSFALQLCYVAAGKIDATVGSDVAWHDGAAATLIAREAGVNVTTFTDELWQPAPGNMSSLVAANPALHQDLLTLVKNW